MPLAIQYDKQQLAELVVGAMADHGWENVNIGEVTVQRMNQLNPNAPDHLYKVICGSTVDPQVVALHCHGEYSMSTPARVPKERAALRLFAEGDLGLPVLASAEDWFIQPWAGETIRHIMPASAEYPAGLPLILVPKRNLTKRLVFEDLNLTSGGQLTLTLASHPGKALVLSQRIDKVKLPFTELDVFFPVVGDIAQAMHVTSDGSFIRLVDKRQQVFEVPYGQYDEGSRIVIFADGGRASQAFIMNNDHTISPRDSPSMVWGVPGPEECATTTEVAHVLAKIHSLPTRWYDEWRQHLCDQYPVLKEVPLGSHLWAFTTRPHVDPGFEVPFGNLSDELLKQWVAAGPVPASSTGARLVTAHCDFFPNNLIRTINGLRVIDLDFSCVTSAAEDLACMCTEGLEGASLKREFVAAYISACGEAAGPEETDSLLLDAESRSIAYAACVFSTPFHSEMALHKLDKTYNFPDCKGYVRILDEARSNTELRNEIFEKGVRKCSRALL